MSEDQYGFVLSQRDMQHETDDQVAVPVVEDLAKRLRRQHSAIEAAINALQA